METLEVKEENKIKVALGHIQNLIEKLEKDVKQCGAYRTNSGY